MREVNVDADHRFSVFSMNSRREATAFVADRFRSQSKIAARKAQSGWTVLCTDTLTRRDLTK